MNILILCDQTDCTFNKRYYPSKEDKNRRISAEGSNHCKHSQPIFMPQSDHSICITKDIKIDGDTNCTHIGYGIFEQTYKDKSHIFCANCGDLIKTINF